MTHMPDISQFLRGSGGGKGAKNEKNTLRSNATVRFIALLSDGEIVGPTRGDKDIILNETRLEADNGNKNFKGVTWDFRPGLPDQAPFDNFQGVEQEISVGVRVTKNNPITRSLTDPDFTHCRVTVRIPALFKQSDKGMKRTSVTFRIEVRHYNGSYVDPFGEITLTGKNTSGYDKQYMLKLPKAPAPGVSYPWEIRITRITPDAEDNTDEQNELYFGSLTGIIDETFIYPDSALIAMAIDAEQFEQGTPTLSVEGDGAIIKVPSNYDPVNRTYSGIWNGTFKEAFTDNPAWIYYDIVTNKRVGMGNYVDPSTADKWALYEIGAYCDQLVPDGFGGMEPRFRMAAYLTEDTECYELLQLIASAFRGMSFWSSGSVTAVQDRPSDVVQLVARANVIDGEFVYSSSAHTARNTVVHVKYMDPNDMYKPAVEVVRDTAGILRYGERVKEINAFGCTSRGQARRLGMWILQTELYETQTVTYRAGMDSASLQPGDNILVMDERISGVDHGGRIKQIVSSTVLKLDREITVKAGKDYTIYVTMPDGSVASSRILNSVGTHTQVTLATALPSTPVSAAVWVLSVSDVAPRPFRVLANVEKEDHIFEITALQIHTPKYEYVDHCARFDAPSYRESRDLVPPTNLTAKEYSHFVNGVPKVGITVSWEGDPKNLASVFRVEVIAPGDADRFTYPRLSGYSVDIEDVVPGLYTIRVYTLGLASGMSAPAELLFDARGWGQVVIPEVRNLKLSRPFTTPDCEISWENYFPGGPSNNSMYKANTVEVYGVVDGVQTLRRKETVFSPSYTYTIDKNRSDGTPARRLVFKVTASYTVAGIDVTSPQSELVAYNEPIPAPTVKVENGIGQFMVSWSADASPDYVKSKIWIEKTSGFDPRKTSPAFEGSVGLYPYYSTDEDPRYIRVAHVDTFSETDFIASSEVVGQALQIKLDVEPPAAPTGLKLSSTVSSSDPGFVQLIATWNANKEEDLAYYDVELKEGSSNYVSFQTSTTTSNWRVKSGVSFTARVSAVDRTGNRSISSSPVTHTSAKDTTPPTVPVFVSAKAGLDSIWLDWKAATDADFSYVELWENTTNNSATATQIATAFGTSFARTGLAHAQTRYYWLKAVDTSGNKSAFSAVISAKTGDEPGVTTEKLQGLIDQTSFANGITALEIVSALPTTGNFKGRTVVLTTDSKIYRYDGAKFVSTVPAADVTGQITDAQIAAIAATKVTGKLTDAQLAEIASTKITGQLTSAQIASLDAAKVAGQLKDSQIEAVSAAKVSGQLTSAQIASLDATKVAGKLTDAQLTAISAAKITGQLALTQIVDIPTTKITGQLTNDQIASVDAAKIAGQIASTQIADNAVTVAKIADDAVTAAKIAANAVTASELASNAVTAAKIASNAVTTAKIAANAVDATKFASGIEPVSIVSGTTLPTTKSTSTIVWGNKLYRWDGTKYTAEVATVDLTGTVSSTQIADNAVTTSKIAAGAVATGKIAANAVTSNEIAALAVTAGKIADNAVTTNQIAANAITTGKIAANAVTATQIANLAVTAGKVASNAITATEIANNAVTAGKIAASSVTTDKIAAGALDVTKFASGIEPVTISTAATLPTTKSTSTIVWGNKLYRWDGTKYTVEVASTDITGKLTDSQIADLAATKISGQLTSDQISAIASTKITGQLTSAQIASLDASKVSGKLTDAQLAAIDATKVTGQIVGTQIKDGEIATAKIAAGAITTAKVAAGAITANEIGANAVTAVKVAAGAITAGKIATDAVTANEIAANAITSSELAAGSVVTGKIAANAVTANEIAANAVTAAKISAGAVTTAKIAADAVTANEIAANAVTASEIAAGAVTTAKIAAGAVTANEVAANAITTAKIAAGAVGADQIAAKSITAQHLVLSDWTNLADAWMSSPKAWSYGKGFSFEETLPAAIQARAAIKWTGPIPGTTSGYLSDGIPQNLVPVEEGKTYSVRVRRYSVGANGNAVTYIRWFDAKGASLTENNFGGLAITNEVIQEINNTFTAPAGAAFMNVRHRRGAAANEQFVGEIYWYDLSITKRFGAELIVDGAITTNKIDANAVTTAKIAANAVTATELAAGSVTAGKIAANAVTATEIAAGAVSTSELAANAVTAAAIAAGAVTAGKIGANAVTANEIAAGSVVTGKIAAGAVTATELAANAVTADKILANAVTAVKISSGAVTTDKIAANAVTANEIAAGAITTGKIAANAITATEIAAGAVAASELAANAVTAAAIAANAVTTDKINANAITSAKIAAGAVTADQIASKAITAAKLAITDTSAVNIDPMFEDAVFWSSATIPVKAITDGIVGSKVLYATALVNYANHNNKFVIDPTKTYLFETYLRALATTTTKSFAMVRFFDANGAVIQSVSGTGWPGTSGNNHYFPAINTVTPTTWTRYTVSVGPNGTAKFPPGTVSCCIGLYANYSGTPVVEVQCNMLRVTEMSRGELIVDGAISTAKLTADAVTSEKIAAGSITARQLVVGDFANLIPDPDFANLDQGSWYNYAPKVGTIERYVGVEGSGVLITKFADQTGEISARTENWRSTAIQNFVPVKAGDKLRVQCTVTRKAGSSGGNIGLYADIRKADGTVSGTGISGVAGTTPTVDLPIEVSGEYTIPADVVGIRFRLYYGSNASSAGGSVAVTNIGVRRMNTAELIVDGAVTTNKLSANAVTAAKIAAETITAAQIAANAVTTAKIATGAVTANEIAADAVTAVKLAAGSVTAGKIAAESITSNEIAANAVTASEIASGAITTAKLAAGAVTANEIASNAVTAVKIAAGAVTAGKIAADSITAAEIAANAITSSELSAGSVIAGKIATDAVTANTIAANAVTAEKVAANSITARQLVLTDPDNIVSNGDFSQGLDGWDTLTTTAVTVVDSPGTNPPYSKCLYLPSRAAAYQEAWWNGSVPKFPCKGGDVYFVEACVYADATVDTFFRFNIRYANNVNTTRGSAYITASANTAGVWTKISGHITIPATVGSNPVTHMTPYVGGGNTGTVTGSGWYVSGIKCTRAVNAELIVDGAITTEKIAAKAITAGKIAADSITAAEIAANAITSSELAAGSVITAKIAAGAVTANEIAANAVTAAKLDAGAVTAGKIAAGAIVAGDIAANAITTAKLAADAVTADKIAANAVTASEIAANAVTAGKIAVGAVGADQIAAGSITAKHLVLTDWTNLADAWMTTPQGWSLKASYTFETSLPTAVSARAAIKWAGPLTAGTSGFLSDISPSSMVPVEEGKTYSVRVRRYCVGANGNTNSYIRWYDAKGTNISENNFGGLAITNEVIQEVNNTFTAPAGAAFMNVRHRRGGAASELLTGEVYWYDLSITKRFGAELIVDGAITAKQLSSGEIITNTAQIKDAIITSGKIVSLNANKLEANTALAGSITVNDRALSQVGTTDALLDTFATDWVRVSGSGTSKYSTDAADAVTGSRSFVANADAEAWWRGPTLIPFDPTALYKITFRIRKKSGDDTAARFYLGLMGVAENKTTLVNATGANSTGSQHWVAANNLLQSSLKTTYTEYVGYVQGHAATGTSTSSLAKPAQLHQNVRYFYPEIIVNRAWSATTYEIAVDSVKIETLTAGDGRLLTSIVNAGTTQIDPGKILIAGNTSLADWRTAGDETHIDGGAVSANTIDANKLTIGNRAIVLEGIEFEHNKPSVNKVTWTAGTIRYPGDDGNIVTQNIATGNATWSSGVLYLYFAKGGTAIKSTTAVATAYDKNNVILAAYRGNTDLIANYGRTVIDGSGIKTGTVTANQVAAGAIGATQIAANAIQASHIATGAITAKHMVISDGTNMIPDADIQDPDPANWWMDTAKVGIEPFGWQCFSSRGDIITKVAVTGQNLLFRTSLIPVTEGMRLSLQAGVVHHHKTKSQHYLVVGEYNSSMNRINGPIWNDDTFAAQEGRVYNADYTVPVGVSYIAFEGWSGPAGMAANCAFGGLAVRRKFGGELLVDGSITANKMKVDSLASLSINAGVITAGHLVAANNNFHINMDAGAIRYPDGSIQRSAIIQGEVTDVATYWTDAPYNFSASSNIDVASVTVNVAANEKVVLWGVAYVRLFSDKTITYAAQFKRNGTLIGAKTSCNLYYSYGYAGDQSQNSVTISRIEELYNNKQMIVMHTDVPGAGTHTYYYNISRGVAGNQTGIADQRFMCAIVSRR